MKLDTARIRALNDELRHNLPNPHAVITAGVAALGPDAVARIVQTIAVYDDFCHANDPYEENDFGSFEVEGHVIFFKIDYFGKEWSPITSCDRVALRNFALRLKRSPRTGSGLQPAM